MKNKELENILCNVINTMDILVDNQALMQQELLILEGITLELYKRTGSCLSEYEDDKKIIAREMNKALKAVYEDEKKTIN